jgi:DNA modification methylase
MKEDCGGVIIREERIGDCRLILGDCLEVMPLLGKVDMVCTSPPYDNLREYGAGFNGVDLLRCIELVSERLDVGGVCMWNVADQTVNGSESGSSFKQALHAIKCGLNLHDTMIFEKAQAFGGSNKAYIHSFEYMFIFSNGKPKTFNPIRDRPNVRGGVTESTAGGGMRKDGTIPERSAKTAKPFGKRKNIWKYGVGGGRTGHPAVFPLKMAQDHVKSWTDHSQTILDPFMGSGTTLVACAKLGRKGIGIELDPDYFQIACERVQKAYDQPDLFVAPPEKPTQEGFDL